MRVICESARCWTVAALSMAMWSRETSVLRAVLHRCPTTEGHSVDEHLNSSPSPKSTTMSAIPTSLASKFRSCNAAERHCREVYLLIPFASLSKYLLFPCASSSQTSCYSESLAISSASAITLHNPTSSFEYSVKSVTDSTSAF